MTHPPLHRIEKFMLAVIVAHFACIGWSIARGPWNFAETNILGRFALVASILIGCIAFALIVTRNASGWLALMVFFLPQLPGWDMGGEPYWQLHFLPTIYGDVAGGVDWTLRVNLVALLFFALCSRRGSCARRPTPPA